MPKELGPGWIAPDGRTAERIRHHYRVERELADRLRSSTPEDRVTLYNEVYDELFAQVVDHPQLREGTDRAGRDAVVSRYARQLRPMVPPGSTLLEVGAGDCALSLKMAPHVRRVIATDVSADIASLAGSAENFEFRVVDGRTFPVEDGSIDVAYSNQLLEHLHPDDAREQTANVLATLAPGGRYVCLTPHPLSGPHDVSVHFTAEPTGFHLREYRTRDLVELFRAAGFGSVKVPAHLGRFQAVLPAAPFLLVERLVALLPVRLRRNRYVDKLIRPGGGVVGFRA